MTRNKCCDSIYIQHGRNKCCVAETNIGKRGKEMNEKLYYNAAYIAAMLGISMGKSYKILRAMNSELSSKGFLTIAGEIPVAYFKEKWYGGGKGGGCMSCNAKKDPNGTWRIQYRWTDWTGAKKKSQKRGFKTKKEAEEWYAHFLLQQSSDPTMTLADFSEIYKADMEKRLRKTTMKQKEYVMNDKVLPYFGNTPINGITAPMIRKWQGEMMEKGFKATYLKTIHNQLSAILNYAVNFYDLCSNPCRKAGSMGKSKADERPYWTLEEFQKFSGAIMDKQDSWVAFQILFWTGMCLGELLALQVKDIDFKEGTITVDESLARIDGEDLITAPKTESSIRVITIHKELQEVIKEYISTLYRARAGTRLFASRTKSFFVHEMERGIKLSGVKKITVHCTRHGHASMLVNYSQESGHILVKNFLRTEV